MLLGDGFALGQYVHMGFHPAWKYREVHELIFEAGRLVAAEHRSAELAEFRAFMEQRASEPPQDGPELEAWISRCFDRSYRW